MDETAQIFAKFATLEERSQNTRDDAIEIRAMLKELVAQRQVDQEKYKQDLALIRGEITAQKITMAKWSGIAMAAMWFVGYFIDKYLKK